MSKEYYVYIMTNVARTLYVGVTNDLERRVYEHKHRDAPGFTRRYGLTRLVYFEASSDILSAIEREKQLKGWVRRRKLALIETKNPKWNDLSVGWFDSGALV
jgi:putative endonuclease